MEAIYYSNFKQILEYFVAHLEYLIDLKGNNSKGYTTYIKPLLDEDNESYTESKFAKSGQGYKGHRIQSQVEKWDTYGRYKITITINGGAKETWKSTGNYLNWKYTAFNIRAEWEKDKIIALKLIDAESKSTEEEKMRCTIDELGLFKNDAPNEKLRELFNTYFSLIEEHKKMDEYIKLLTSNGNIILHGAPGTGKTYLAKRIAEVLGATKDNEQFEMVQFHPSYDYTDFVEGLRPTDTDKNGNIIFSRKDGIFKEFCKRAVDAKKKTSKKQNTGVTISDSMIRDAWSSLYNDVDGNYTLVQFRKEGSPRFNKDGDKIRWHVQQADKEHEFVSNQWATCNEILKIHNKFGNSIEVKDGRISLQPGDIKEVSSYDTPNLWAIYNEIYKRALKKVSEEKVTNFVFLIDEINRGDLSKIFGELFFSIDPGYRGEDGKIATQYQNMLKDSEDEFENGFYIPENVYIIGTMNDIDRSVESMDFAMRRRFQFIEVTAEDRAAGMGLKTDTEAYKRMTNLNNWIISKEIGLSTAYQIGGSYFLKKANGKTEPINNESDFKDLWNYRLKGLLREYLRGEDESVINDKLTKLGKAFGIENGELIAVNQLEAPKENA